MNAPHGIAQLQTSPDTKIQIFINRIILQTVNVIESHGRGSSNIDASTSSKKFHFVGIRSCLNVVAGRETDRVQIGMGIESTTNIFSVQVVQCV